MSFKDSHILVFDIGKTHVKVSILDRNGEELYRNRRSNRVMQTQPYHSYDVDGIWIWLKGQLSELSKQYHIKDISIATHGAAAALIDRRTQELLLPVMDYEFEAYPEEFKNYESIRPPFKETGSPSFPAGLNLGRQLYWQCHLLSDQEKENAILLMYPQYWAWKLSGEVATEVTSLGCHTDLWNLITNSPSSLLETLGLREALPPLKKAWEPIGEIKESLAAELGLYPDCAIYPGVHDSNAGYLPILRQPKTNRPTVISTGTWSVIMDGNTDLEKLDASRDMLVNIDAEGSPLATARYMGGREFGLICEQLNTDIATTFVDEDIETIINSNTFIMPSFAFGSGPYPDHQGRIEFDGEVFPINGKAAATIYAALMLNNILKRLNPSSKQDILIEGSFAQNSVLCGLLAALNPKRKVRTQNSGNGVTEGCFLLTRWDDALAEQNNPIVAPYIQDIFPDYAAIWESNLENIV